MPFVKRGMVSLIALLVVRGPLISEEVKIDGVTRKFFVSKPVIAKDAPVVFVFHGHGGTGGYSAAKFAIEKSWPEAAVLYPTGLPTKIPMLDPKGLKNGWQLTPTSDGQRDLKFVDAMISYANKEGYSKSKRYSMGHSNGSAFTWVLLSARNDQFRAYAGFNAGAAFADRKFAPKPCFFSIGLKDEIINPRGINRFVSQVVSNNNCGEKVEQPNGIALYPGANPVWVYEYDGGHKIPDKALELGIQFLKSN